MHRQLYPKNKTAVNKPPIVHVRFPRCPQCETPNKCDEEPHPTASLNTQTTKPNVEGHSNTISFPVDDQQGAVLIRHRIHRYMQEVNFYAKWLGMLSANTYFMSNVLFV